jgi:hypothetical protein
VDRHRRQDGQSLRAPLNRRGEPWT